MASNLILFDHSNTLNRAPHSNITLWLVRWLSFRLMFASGVVKLTSGCPAWWGLTAMNWHYESQVSGLLFCHTLNQQSFL